MVSELTTISQYFYHHLVLRGVNNVVAEILKGIAIVEIKHLELLGEAKLNSGEILNLKARTVTWDDFGLALM